MKTEVERTLVSINEAAKLARVCRRSIYTWLSLGRLDYVRTAGGQVRIYADSLLIPAQFKGVRGSNSGSPVFGSQVSTR